MRKQKLAPTKITGGGPMRGHYIMSVKQWLINNSLIIAPAGIGILITAIFISGGKGSYTDDAYIFFQYAKNLSNGNGLSLNPGEISFGITSILWTLLLTATNMLLKADIVRISPIIGAILFSVTGSLWASIASNITNRKGIGFAAGLLFIINPVCIYHAVSGMDTSLNIFIFSLLIYSLVKYEFKYPLLIGILAGLNFLSRPESLILLPLILLYLVLTSLWKKKIVFHTILKQSGYFLFSFFIMILPWTLLVFKHTGNIIPPTRIGKLLYWLPATYNLTFTEFNSLSFFDHLILIGKNAILLFSQASSLTILPYLLIFVVGMPVMLKLSHNDFKNFNILIFLYAYIILLFIILGFYFPVPRLRYFTTIIPISISGATIIVLYSLNEKLRFIKNYLFSNRKIKIISIILCILIFSIYLSGLALTYNDYKQDIERTNVKVTVGTWLKYNTPTDSVVALVPIGAVSFYSDRYILDMGGLINTEIWNYVEEGYNSSPDSIYQFLRKKQPNYVIYDEYLYKNYPALSIHEVFEMYPSNFRLIKTINNSELDPEAGSSFRIYKALW